MIIIFIDTNLLLQCKGLEELPWHDISNDPIDLLLTRPVQEEIDKLKYDGNERRSKRARKINSLIRKILSSPGNEITLDNSSIEIKLKLVPPQKDTKHSCDSLDLSKPDDRIISEALKYKAINPDSDVFLLTHDTGPMYTADLCGLNYIPIPDTWLLSPESSKQEKEIKRLKDEIKKLEYDLPKVSVLAKNMEGSTIDSINHYISKYSEIDEKHLADLLEQCKKASPVKSDFAEPQEFNFAPAQKILNRGKKYYPPEQKEIDAYQSEAYPEWTIEIKDYLSSLPSKLNNLEDHTEITVSLINDGGAPAENVMVRFELGGNYYFSPGSKEENNEENAILSDLPKPPSPPTGTYKEIETRGTISSMRGLLETAAKLYPGLSDPLLPLSPIVPPKHDRHAFYYKERRPISLVKKLEYVCDQFLHKIDDEVFTFLIVSHKSEPTENGVLICTVTAKNLREPVIKKIPIFAKDNLVSVDSIMGKIIGKIRRKD